MINGWQEISVRFFVEEIFNRYWHHTKGTEDKVLELQGNPLLSNDECNYEFPYRVFIGSKLYPLEDNPVINFAIKVGEFALGVYMTYVDVMDGDKIKFMSTPILNRKEMYNLFLNVFMGYNLELPETVTKVRSIDVWYRYENGERVFDKSSKKYSDIERKVRVRRLDLEDFNKISKHIIDNGYLPKELVRDDLEIKKLNKLF